MRKIIKQKKGYTLIELLLALGVIAILAVGIFYLYAKVSDDMVVNKVNNEVLELSAAVNEVSDSPAFFTLSTGGSAYITNEAMVPYIGESYRKKWDEEGVLEMASYNIGLSFYYGYEDGKYDDVYNSIILDLSSSKLSETQCIKTLTRLRANNPPIFNIGMGQKKIEIKDIPDLCKDGKMDANFITYGVSPARAGG